MKIIISHPTGNQFVRNAVKSLQQHKSLYCFITSLNFTIKKKFLFFFPKFIRDNINRRSFKGYTTNIISTSVFFELVRLTICRFLKIEGKEEKLARDIDLFTARYISKHKDSIDAVYAYENVAIESFKEARKHNIKCIYELPSAHWSFYDKNTKPQRRLDREYELKLADVIIVASTWAAKSFNRFPQHKSKIRILPYGFPEKVNTNRKNWYDGKKPLRALYVGQFTDRKGIPFLIKALNRIPKNLLELTFVGDGPYKKELQKNFYYAKFIATCAHEDVLKTMRKNDVFIMPSLADGFGLVIAEAMSQGMVTVATEHTALKDIYNGRNSILIPPRNANKIYESILFLINNPQKVRTIGLAALQYSKKNTWSKYRTLFYKILRSHVCK